MRDQRFPFRLWLRPEERTRQRRAGRARAPPVAPSPSKAPKWVRVSIGRAALRQRSEKGSNSTSRSSARPPRSLLPVAERALVHADPACKFSSRDSQRAPNRAETRVGAIGRATRIGAQEPDYRRVVGNPGLADPRLPVDHGPLADFELGSQLLLGEAQLETAPFEMLADGLGICRGKPRLRGLARDLQERQEGNATLRVWLAVEPLARLHLHRCRGRALHRACFRTLAGSHRSTPFGANRRVA